VLIGRKWKGMARIKREELTPLVNEAWNDLRPLWEQEKKADFKFQSKVSPWQFQMAKRLAQLPGDESLHYILAELATRLNMSLALLRERREVGVAFPNPHPGIFFRVYAELVKAEPEDRDAIFGSVPKDIDPEHWAVEDWTAEKMKVEVRRFYVKADRAQRSGRVERKTFVIRGLGRVNFNISDTGVEVIFPVTLDFAVVHGLVDTTLRASFEDGGEEAVAV
jgi:hypothetical protein